MRVNVDGIWYIINKANKVAELCSNDESDYIEDDELDDSDDFDFEDGSYAIDGYFAVPAYIVFEGEEYRVNSIGRFAFCDCSRMLGIMLPNTIEYINEDAFNGVALEKVDT